MKKKDQKERDLVPVNLSQYKSKLAIERAFDQSIKFEKARSKPKAQDASDYLMLPAIANPHGSLGLRGASVTGRDDRKMRQRGAASPGLLRLGDSGEQANHHSQLLVLSPGLKYQLWPNSELLN